MIIKYNKNNNDDNDIKLTAMNSSCGLALFVLEVQTTDSEK